MKKKNEENNYLYGLISKTIDGGSKNDTKWMKKNLCFVYLNGRPINPLKSLIKIFNEIYKKYNPNGKYFFLLNLCLDNSYIDFNVSPDKREVFISHENLLI